MHEPGNPMGVEDEVDERVHKGNTGIFVFGIIELHVSISTWSVK
jgi:hypothetical protein